MNEVFNAFLIHSPLFRNRNNDQRKRNEKSLHIHKLTKELDKWKCFYECCRCRCRRATLHSALALLFVDVGFSVFNLVNLRDRRYP